MYKKMKGILEVKPSKIHLTRGIFFLTCGIFLSVVAFFHKEEFTAREDFILFMLLAFLFLCLGSGSLLYYKRSRIGFTKNSFTVRRWLGREEEYTYEQLTDVKIQTWLRGRPVYLYCGKKKAAVFRMPDENYKEALAMIRALEVDCLKDKELDRWIPYTPIMEKEIGDFCNTAYKVLEEEIIKRKKETEDLGVVLHYGFEKETEGGIFFLAITTKNKIYVRLNKIGNRGLWGIPILLIYKKDGKYYCNKNYKEQFTQDRWKEYIAKTKKYGVIEVEQQPALQLLSRID
ncbi:hypothetical protein D7X25_14205 [bacterium 1XD42-8]|jgi:hypothetical protein|nr:hypothetical protein [Lachnospiraceae bacterium]RKJ52683.1 hypothetical protein D7X25_14205 [bacterium 1XD42-8]